MNQSNPFASVVFADNPEPAPFQVPEDEGAYRRLYTALSRTLNRFGIEHRRGQEAEARLYEMFQAKPALGFDLEQLSLAPLTNL
jgi:hypothetical protein